jgi:conserved oligomeric Golgi complex subunit 3
MASNTTIASPIAPRIPVSSSHVSFEKFAPRSASQVSRLSRIAALTAGPMALANNGPETQIAGGSTHYLMDALAPPPPRDEWDDWICMPVTASSRSEDSKEEDDPDGKKRALYHALQETLRVTEGLTQQLKHTTSLRLALRASINISEDISNRHADLIRHSGELSAAADRLQEEEAVLTRHAQEIGKPLEHYDAVDRIGILVGVLFKGKTTVRGLAKLKVDNDEFPSVLDEIDNAIEYFGRESGGKEALQAEMKRRSSGKDSGELLSGSIEYYRRAVALQEAALFLIKEAVADRVTNTTAQIAGALGLPNKTVPADQLEASLIYTRFHGISSRSNRLLSLVKARFYRNEAYPELLNLCRNTYCTQRQSLLLTTVRAHMDKLKEQHGPVGMTRLASVFLIRLCTVETSLYLDFFGEKKVVATEDKATGDKAASKSSASALTDDPTYKDAQLQQFLMTICSGLHRTVRRSLVTMLDLDTLCQIVSVLREERSMASSSPVTMGPARAISSVIEDAQERLIFCANTTLNKEVIRFKATPQDLDYPDKLKKKKSEPPAASATPGDMDAMEKQLEQVYESWFPPMRSVLHILSKIFRVVEVRVFEDIALQSVQACTASLKSAAAYIKQRKGQTHSDLFLVKHLLILREQLSPFDIELRSVERQLDFSDAGKAVARFLANRNRRLFSLNTSENALFTLLREGVSVQESSVDSKRDLEDALRSACNDFIEHTSNSAAGGILHLIEQHKSPDTNALAKRALLDADSVQNILTKTLVGMEESMGNVTTEMALYLDNPGTQSILLKPVSRKVARAVEDLRKMVAKVAGDESGWTSDMREKAEESLQAIEQAIKKSAKASR